VLDDKREERGRGQVNQRSSSNRFALMRKNVLSDLEGKALLQKLLR
jgi:hypothetical protein